MEGFSHQTSDHELIRACLFCNALEHRKYSYDSKMLNDDQILVLLRSRRELSVLCSQNGWIDSDTICYEIVEQSNCLLILNVSFQEIVMEGSGCVAGRVACYGEVKIEFLGSSDKPVLTVTR